MGGSFYKKTALSNIKKNYRFFLPRILTESGLLGCFYIVYTLCTDKRLSEIRGGDYLPIVMIFGSIITALLSVILMFYTNSFLMKQRKHEFGLYNILGMEKRHVGKVLWHETLICSLTSLILGLIFGIVFYKICSLLICKLLAQDVVFGFYFINLKSIVPSALLFLILDILTYLFNRISIIRMKPVELLSSKHSGEKEPKVKWIMLVLGLVCLVAGYYISITTTNPLQALMLFFFAVVLVIIGTYFLFITGTIFILKVLKNKKKYYYNKKHMPAVSGLLYRMKQNAVGLASITVLACGVLVMISTTVSLYAGAEQTLNDNYPQHLYYSAGYSVNENNYELSNKALKNATYASAKKNNVEIESLNIQRYLEVSFLLKGNRLYYDQTNSGISSLDSLAEFAFITLDDYKLLTGKSIDLNDNEIAVCTMTRKKGDVKPFPKKLYLDDTTFTLKKNLDFFPISCRTTGIVKSFGVVVSNTEVLDTIYQVQKQVYGKYCNEYTNRVAVAYKDIDKVEKVSEKLENDIWVYAQNEAAIESGINKDEVEFFGSLDTKWDAKASIYGMYGSLLFLGILLGFVFLFATGLIIYYKQISEGYEDRGRFQIMQKVGMSQKEIKKTIKSQILLVFFLPLIVAGVHLAVAFPMLVRLLRILLLSKVSLFIICTVIVFAVFSLIYFGIYALTAKTYYKIVK